MDRTHNLVALSRDRNIEAGTGRTETIDFFLVKLELTFRRLNVQNVAVRARTGAVYRFHASFVDAVEMQPVHSAHALAADVDLLKGKSRNA